MAWPACVDHCVELLGGCGAVRVRRMFGGWGLWLDGLFVALILNEQLYLKVGPAQREAFAAAGCAPFTYQAAGRRVTLGFWSAPPEAMDSVSQMTPWLRLAQQAALSAAAARPARVQRAPKAVRATRTALR